MMQRFWQGTLLAVGWFFLAESAGAQTTNSSVRFQFREPRTVSYRVELPAKVRALAAVQDCWLKAWPEAGSTNHVELGSRLTLQIASPDDLPGLLKDRPLQIARQLGVGTFILQAPDAWTALVEAEQLAGLTGVLACSPVTRRQRNLNGTYAAQPNDPYFKFQWNLENRATDGSPTGVDLNVRSAWPQARGEGVLIAVADDGVELTHPDLIGHTDHPHHFNFFSGSTNGNPAANSSYHGTAVAGLAAAEGGNNRGMSGVAPLAQLASWVILSPVASDEQFMDMFQFHSNVVSIQNHSWAPTGVAQDGPSLLEQIGISNAITFGRNGRGVVMVRAGGNDRTSGKNSNDDGYDADPRVIPVAAVRIGGRVTSYSSPGANLLVAAPSGDASAGTANLFTTDRVGSLGANQITFTNDFADYAFDSLGFSGTSGSAPQIAGLAALILSANPNLTYRDVQQIMILSARHFDLTDPGLTTNGAGFRVSHNAGFGVPDAGVAVSLARNWINRPALTTLTLTNTAERTIPDQGFAVGLTGDNIPTPLLAIPALEPAEGLHPDSAPGEQLRTDSPTASLPLVYVGYATSAITTNLTGKGALIQRGPIDAPATFSEKISRAEQAGAAFAVIFDHTDNSFLTDMLLTTFPRIPTTFISLNQGLALAAQTQTNTSVRAQLRLNPATYSFTVTNQMLLEHVGVRVQLTHARRGDLRITLRSPQGTTSILSRANSDQGAASPDWTYYSTHHFYESSVGVWTLQITDEVAGTSGTSHSASLVLRGVPIIDSDADGLDDPWEMTRFGSLAAGPKEDPDLDGYSNAREQIMNTDPQSAEMAFKIDLSLWNENRARLSWPGSTNYNYAVHSGSAIDLLTTPPATLSLVTNVAGTFPETEVFISYTNTIPRFFRVIRVP
jgi:subtilisin-like proprotein convertase family protein/subtilisin family serine protease